MYMVSISYNHQKKKYPINSKIKPTIILLKCSTVITYEFMVKIQILTLQFYTIIHPEAVFKQMIYTNEKYEFNKFSRFIFLLFSLIKLWVQLHLLYFYNLNCFKCESQSIILDSSILSKQRIQKDQQTPTKTAGTFGLVMYFSNYCFQCSLSMNTLKPFRIYYSSKCADCSHTLNSCSCVDCKMQYLYLFHAGIKNPYHKCLENKASSFPGKCK